MRITSAEFVISVANAANIVDSGMAEFAMCGRSNVGKSSFINFITNRAKLAKTSKDPGRTRLINYFNCNGGQFMLVDLPGYGFARVSEAEKAKWGELMEGYLLNSKNLRNVFLLLDIRHDPSEDDVLMVNYLNHYAISFTVIATKADKLSRSAQMKRRRELANFLALGVDNIIVVSSETGVGREAMEARLDELLTK